MANINVTLIFVTPNNGRIPVRELKVRIRPEGNAFYGVPRSKEFKTDRAGEIKFSLPKTTGNFFIDVKECTSRFDFVATGSVTLNQGMLNNPNHPYRFTVVIREAICRLPINRAHNNSPSVSPRENLPEFKGSGTLTLAQFIEYYADDVLNREITRYVGNDSSPRTVAAAIGNRVINYPLRNLEASDFVAAGTQLNIEANAIRAFYEVEAAGAGFLPCGIPKILYERHKVYSESGGQNNPLNRGNLHDRELSLSRGYRRRNERGMTPQQWAQIPPTEKYQSDLKSWARFVRAVEKSYTLENVAAGVSWGGFQVMGFNFRTGNFSSAVEMANAAFKDEKGHLKMFVGYARNNRELCSALREHRWTDAARIYNGSGDVTRYGIDIGNAYTRLNSGR